MKSNSPTYIGLGGSFLTGTGDLPRRNYRKRNWYRNASVSEGVDFDGGKAQLVFSITGIIEHLGLLASLYKSSEDRKIKTDKNNKKH